MFINEVEHIVGLSKKSIRYYEENRLLTPKRNSQNGYRIYDETDIKKLKMIKFLRELGVSIRDLKLLNEHKISLAECMEERIRKIDEQEKNYLKIKNMCLDIANSNISFEKFNIEEYFKMMNVLNKEGFTMRDIKTNKSKKIRGAIISSLVFGSFFFFLIVMVSYFQFTEASNMYFLIYIFLLFLFSIPIIGIIVNLIARIKEINGGEEDEASKY